MTEFQCVYLRELLAKRFNPACIGIVAWFEQEKGSDPSNMSDSYCGRRSLNETDKRAAGRERKVYIVIVTASFFVQKKKKIL